MRGGKGEVSLRVTVIVIIIVIGVYWCRGRPKVLPSEVPPPVGGKGEISTPPKGKVVKPLPPKGKPGMPKLPAPFERVPP